MQKPQWACLLLLCLLIPSSYSPINCWLSTPLIFLIFHFLPGWPHLLSWLQLKFILWWLLIIQVQSQPYSEIHTCIFWLPTKHNSKHHCPNWHKPSLNLYLALPILNPCIHALCREDSRRWKPGIHSSFIYFFFTNK